MTNDTTAPKQSSVRDNLIAAKALIDTPEKLAKVGSVKMACTMAAGVQTGRDPFIAFLSEPGDPEAKPGHGSYVVVSFQSIMDRFDRAIAKATGVSS